jgi:hypothetical protein
MQKQGNYDCTPNARKIERRMREKRIDVDQLLPCCVQTGAFVRPYPRNVISGAGALR